jgi:anti-sigma-K factor RskA
MNTDCETLRELLPAYAIGAADPEEIRQMEAGLADCPELADELAEYHRLAPVLAQAVPQVTPPASVWAGLLDEARRARPPRRPAVRWGWVAAAFLALLLGASNLYWLNRLNAQPRLLVLPASVQGESTNAAAHVIWSPDGTSAALIAQRFPPPGPDQVFQAWVRRDGRAISLGTFTVDAEGTGLLKLDPEALAEPYVAFGVTIEPLGGSPAPTTPPVVRWQAPV